MLSGNGESEEERVVEAVEKARGRSGRLPLIERLFLLDIIRDPESRPTLLYAGGTLLAGVIAYHFIEGWDYFTALYFCVITLATIGYGDVTPTTPLGRGFTIFYAINGIVTLLALFDRIRVVRATRRR